MILNARTKVTLGFYAATLAVLGTTGFSGVWSISRMSKGYEDRQALSEQRQDTTEKNIEKMLGQLQNHQSLIDGLIRDRFSMTAAAEAALRQAIENPGMRVVDPRDPTKVIVVNARHTPP